MSRVVEDFFYAGVNVRNTTIVLSKFTQHCNCCRFSGHSNCNLIYTSLGHQIILEYLKSA